MKKFLCLVLFLFTFAASAAALTDAQKAALHADMVSRPELASYLAAGDDVALANFYNAIAVPAFVVWRTSVPSEEIFSSTTFDWTRVDNLTVGKARVFDWMLKNGRFNPSSSNIRAGIDAAWVGTAADLAVRAAVYALCKRSATLAEKLLATGTGSNASPAVLSYEGTLSYAEISEVRVWQ